MADSSLKQRIINVTMQLNAPGPSEFNKTSTLNSSGDNTVNLTGHRVSVKVLKAGTSAAEIAQVHIYGMAKNLMDKITTLGMNPYSPNLKKTSMTIEAGEKGKKPGIVFIGAIFSAFSDYNSAPDVTFNIEAQTNYFDSVAVVDPASFKGPTDVEVMLNSLAAQMNLKPENSGVKVTLPSSYYYGSPRQQAIKIAQDANISIAFDLDKLAFWPKGQARNGTAPLVSKNTGMVGYPTYTNQGILLKTLYNPAIVFGSAIKVESDFKPASGEWIVFSVDYDLDSYVPNGQWFMTIQASRRGTIPVAIR